MRGAYTDTPGGDEKVQNPLKLTVRHPCIDKNSVIMIHFAEEECREKSIYNSFLYHVHAVRRQCG